MALSKLLMPSNCYKAINKFKRLVSFFNMRSTLSPEELVEDRRLVFRDVIAMLLFGLERLVVEKPGLLLVKMNNSDKIP